MSAKRTVVFVDFSDAFHDRHPIYCLSAYLKRENIDVEYLRVHNSARAIEQIRHAPADLLMYSAYSRDIRQVVGFDRMVKERAKVRSLLGGPGATFDPHLLKDSTIDFLCLGEGEESAVDFIKNGFKPVGNIVRAQDPDPCAGFYPFLDLNTAPFPDREVVYSKDRLLRDLPSKQFLSGRGCPYMCTYCHNNIQNRMFKDCGPVVRKKSVGYLLEEIKEVKKRYALKLVVFQDDTFIINKEWFFEFCERFPREIGLPYTCNIRACLIDEQKVKALKESGCVCAYWSIESGNDFIRTKILKRQETREQIQKTGQLLTKYKISHRSGGIIGLPGETYEQMLETLELNIEIKPDFGFSSIFIPFPGLELTAYAVERGHLSKEASDNLPGNTHVTSVLNFSLDDKMRIEKLTFLWPFLVSFPGLFYNKKNFELLFRLPRRLLCLFFHVFSGYKQSKLYKLEIPLSTKFALLFRYLRNPF